MDRFRKAGAPARRVALIASSLGVLFASIGCATTPGAAGGGQFLTREESQRMEAQKVVDIQAEIAKEKKKPTWEVEAKDIMDNPKIKELEISGQEGESIVQQWMDGDPESMATPPSLTGFKKIDFNGSSPVLNYAAEKPRDPANPAAEQQFATFKEVFGGKVLVNELKLTITPPAPPVEKGKPAPPPPAPTVRTVFFGPIEENASKALIDNVQKTNTSMKIETIKSYPTEFYENDKGRVIAVIKGGFKWPHRAIGSQNMFYWRTDPETLKKIQETNKAATKPDDKRIRMPRQIAIPIVAERPRS
jgi:hypothetical protein